MLDDAVLPVEQLGQIDLRRAELDAVRAHLADFVDDLGGMQQRLGGNAADVEADAAQHRPAFDQRDLESEVGGAEGGGVAAGAGAQHQQLCLAVVRHVGLERPRGLRRGAAARAGAAAALARRRSAAFAAARRQPSRRARRCRGRRPAESPSMRAIKPPLPILPPFCTSTSVTVPAAVDGTSIVALSVSSVTSGVSTSILSPTLTSTSTTATSSKLPRSGTTRSILLTTSPRADPAGFGERVGEEFRDARAQRAVDDAMVIRERQRQHQARHELPCLPHRLHRRLRHTEDGHLGRIDDGREQRAADAAQARDGEARALHVGAG